MSLPGPGSWGGRAMPTAVSGADVVPGRPDGVRQLATTVRELSDGLAALAATMQDAAPGGWRGPASIAFQQLVSFDVPAAQRALAAMAQAAEHLDGHAVHLAQAQELAETALRLDRHGADLSRAWVQADAPAPDPGEAWRQRALAVAAEARQQARRSAEAAAQGLAAATRLAPRPESFLHRRVSQVNGWRREAAIGGIESTLQLAGTALVLDPRRFSYDPSSYLSDLGSVGTGTWQAFHHPEQVGEDLLDWDTLRESPCRWIGHQAPALALGFATGGGATAARVSSVTARGLARLPGERAQSLATALAERSTYGRSGLRASDLRRYRSTPSEFGTVTRLGPVSRAVGASVLRDAAWAEKEMSPRIERVAEETDALRVGHDAVLKGKDSLFRKLSSAAAEPAAGTSTGLGRGAPSVNDTVRYTLVYGDDVYVSKAASTVKALQDEGFTLTKAKSFWGSDRYEGVNLTLHDPQTGRLLEVQLHTPRSWEITKATHDDYELFRDVNVPPALKQQLERGIADQFATVPRPHGIDDLARQLKELPTDDVSRSTTPELLSVDGARLARHVAAGITASRVPADPQP